MKAFKCLVHLYRYIFIAAYIQQKERRERDRLKASHQEALDSKTKMQADASNAENERAQKRYKNLKEVAADLEEILDIRCSYFKSRDQREKLQRELLEKRRRLDLSDIVTHGELEDIFEKDVSFCGYTRKENGRLRHVYMQHWKLKVQEEKQSATLKKN